MKFSGSAQEHGPLQAKMYVQAIVDREGLDHPTHSLCLITVCTALEYCRTYKRKANSEIKLRYCLTVLSTSLGKTLFVWRSIYIQFSEDYFAARP